MNELTALIQEALREFKDEEVDIIGDFITHIQTDILEEKVGSIGFASAINILYEEIQTSPRKESFDEPEPPDGLDLHKREVEKRMMETA